MNALFRSLSISKQSFHQKLDRFYLELSEQRQLLVLIYQIRKDHPTMGCRDMYYKLNPECMGRDAFELFCKKEGLMAPIIRNWQRTTDSSGVVRFDNLLKDLTINRINQVWQSDITYFDLKGKFYYITFIIDAWSRRIVGHHTSERLFTENTTLPALKMALRQRKGQNMKGLIFHSDGGGQYYDKAFLELTNDNDMVNSMCEYAWENGKAERINGVIKNNYLKHKVIESFKELCKEVDRSVKLYNNEKPHIKLNRNTPINFENKYIWADKKSDEGEVNNKITSFSKEIY